MSPVRGTALLVLALCGSLALGAAGQEPATSDEGRILRRAAGLESRGDYAAAEALLQELLEDHPSSSGGLFALERVLRAQGRVEAILPVADRFLATAPTDAGARYMKLRVLVEIGADERLDTEADRWIEAAPGSDEPFREVARLYEEAFGAERSLAMLRRGVAALGPSPALSLAIGDVHARSGDTRAAVEAWSEAVRGDDTQIDGLLRRVRDLPRAERAAAGTLVSALRSDPTTPERLRAAVWIAVEAGSFEAALDIAERLVGDVPPSARRSLLADLARSGEEAGAADFTLWAYRALRDVTEDPTEVSRVQGKVAAAAIAAGDTALAIEAQVELARALPARSEARRRAVVDLIRVEAYRASPADLRRRLDGFRSEFPEAPELDDLSATVAARLRARGFGEAAQEVLSGVRGPRSSLERAFLSFDDGDLEAGRAALEQALGLVDPAAATEVIQLIGLLDRLEGAQARAVASASARAHRGDPARAVSELTAAVEAAPREDRPALLAHAARLADAAGDAERASELRGRLLSEHADAPEVAEATLELALYVARDSTRRDEAVDLLRGLILERPDSPVTPAARRALQRLERGGDRT